jgi:hypothetical protein
MAVMIENTAAAAGSSPERGVERRKNEYRVDWGRVTLTVGQTTVRALACRTLSMIPELSDIRVHASPGELAVTLTVRRYGVPLSVRVTLSQLRFKEGFLAFVLDRVEALSFVPVPDSLIAFLAERGPHGLLTYYRDDRIMVVNVNSWMPGGFDLSLDRAEFMDGEVAFHFGAGSYDLTDILQRDRDDEEEECD